MRRVLLTTAVLLVAGAAPAVAEDTVLLTVHHTGRDGGPATQYETVVVNKETREGKPLNEGSVRLPSGRYALQSTIRSTGSTDFLSYPNLDLAKDTAIDLAASAAKPLVIRPPDPSAKLRYAEIELSFGGLSVNSLDGLAIAHLGPRDRDGVTLINTQWEGAAYYGLAWFFPDGLPNGLRRTPSHTELAKVNAEFGASLPGKVGWRMLHPATGPSDVGDYRGGTSTTQVALPSSRTEYYNPETYWLPALYQLKTGEQPPTPEDVEIRLFPRAKKYQAGRTYDEAFNYAVAGPALPDAGLPTAGVQRSADTLSVWVPMFTDDQGNAASVVTTDKASTVLYRDGVRIGENELPGSGSFEIPRQDSTYRLEASASRAGVARLSSQVSVAWTFRSSAAKTGLLPLSTIRFAPRLDGDTGRPLAIPVFLRDQHSETDRVADQLSVDVSFDEGGTWKAARVLQNSVVVIEYPQGNGAVSLRGKATDRHGNTVEQTVINAYQTGQGT